MVILFVLFSNSVFAQDDNATQPDVSFYINILKEQGYSDEQIMLALGVESQIVNVEEVESRLLKLENLMSSLNSKVNPIHEQVIRNSATIREIKDIALSMVETIESNNRNSVQIANFVSEQLPMKIFLMVAVYFNIIVGIIAFVFMFIVARKFFKRVREPIVMFLQKREIKVLKEKQRKAESHISKYRETVNKQDKIIKAINDLDFVKKSDDLKKLLRGE